LRAYARKQIKPKQVASLQPIGLTQRRIGNQVTPRLPYANAEAHGARLGIPAPTRFAHDFSRIPAHSKTPISLQPKLEVNTPGDINEQEANPISERVAGVPAPRQQGAGAYGGCPACRNTRENLQAKHIAGTDSGPRVVPHIIYEVQRSSGQPLAPLTRGFMESRFGYDFSKVRVHTDVRAQNIASGLGARAFTVNRDIVFGVSEYAPHTHAGRRLLAHELTHVVQQQAGVYLRDGVGQPGDAYERHADAVAELVADRKHAGPLLDRMPVSTGSHSAGALGAGVMRKADQPVQMQKAHEQTQPKQATGKSVADVEQEAFQKMLEKHWLNEKVNGPMARELARAYVNRPKIGALATPYIKDWINPNISKEPSEADVCHAILGALDIKKLGKGDKASDWTWKPAASEEGMRDEAPAEIAKWGIREQFGGNTPEEIVEAQIKEAIQDAAEKFATRWLEKKGLEVFLEIISGVGTVVGIYSTVISVLELLILLQKPVKKEMSKQDKIAEDVRGWLAGEQAKAAALQKAAQENAEFKESLKSPYKHEIYVPAPVSTRVIR
jgi:hypothetical protein